MPDSFAIEAGPKRWPRRVILGIVAVTVLVAGSLLGLAIFAFGASRAERVRTAMRAENWSRVVALTSSDQVRRDPLLAKFRMRALFRLGRFREAELLLGRVDVEALDAEDLLEFGKALLSQGEVALGWVALEASNRLDPKFSATIVYMNANRGSRRDLGPVTAQVDRLRAVPDARALAELVIGLARDGNARPGGRSASLERLAALDRATLLGLHGAADARKLVARLLLEDGRVDAAIETLKSRPDLASDREAHWLLSRAQLAAGRVEEAIAERHQSAGFNDDRPLTREPSRYVGANQCRECHQAIYRTQQSSHHAETISRGERLRTVKLPEGPVPDPVDKQVTHRFERKGNTIEVMTDVDRARYRALVEFALGSGRDGQTMIARDDTGGHRSLRISYYAGGESWDLTEPFRPPPKDGLGFLGDLLGEKEFLACLNCHTTRYATFQTPDSPEVADHGIGCERCHGPGELHVRAIDASFPEPVIARPRLATPRDRMALCGSCHSANGEIPPSDPRFIRFQSTTLAYSRCYTESQGQLDCVTCHNPHRNVETAPAYYEEKCLACHAGGESRPASMDSHVGGGLVCKVDARRGCLDCHMPKDPDVMMGSPFTDHHIRIHKDRKPAALPH